MITPMIAPAPNATRHPVSAASSPVSRTSSDPAKPIAAPAQ
jgi:hypothetical protein